MPGGVSGLSWPIALAWPCLLHSQADRFDAQQVFDACRQVIPSIPSDAEALHGCLKRTASPEGFLKTSKLGKQQPL